MTAAEERTPEEWRDDVLEHVLMHVPFDGWTEISIRRAAAELHMDRGFVKLVFPGGPIEMIEHFSRRADARMVAAMEAHGAAEMRIRDRIRCAVTLRLEENAAHREALRRAMAVLALPQHAGLAARSLWRTVDAMWRAAGDTATDYNYYTKRGILAGVYSSTLVVWLGDSSEGFENTWQFLDRRLDNVMAFEKTKARLLKDRENLPSLTGFLGRLRYPQR